MDKELETRLGTELAFAIDFCQNKLNDPESHGCRTCPYYISGTENRTDKCYFQRQPARWSFVHLENIRHKLPVSYYDKKDGEIK